jgi:hypothetical protein
MIKAWRDVLIAVVSAFGVTLRTLWQWVLALFERLSSNAIEAIVISAVTFLGTAFAFATNDQFGVAVALCAVPSIIWFARALHYTGQGQRRPLVLNSIRVGLAVLALSVGAGAYFGAYHWRGAKPWFPLPRSSSGPQIAHNAQSTPEQTIPHTPVPKPDSPPSETLKEPPAAVLTAVLPEEPAPKPPIKTVSTNPRPAAPIAQPTDAETEVKPPPPTPPVDLDQVVPVPIGPFKLTAQDIERIANRAESVKENIRSCLRINTPESCSKTYRPNVADIQRDLHNVGIRFDLLDSMVQKMYSASLNAIELENLTQVLPEIEPKLKDKLAEMNPPKPELPTPKPEPPTPKAEPRTLIVVSVADTNAKIPDDRATKAEWALLANQAADLRSSITGCLHSYESSVAFACLDDRHVAHDLGALQSKLSEHWVVIQELEDSSKEISISPTKESQLRKAYSNLAANANAVAAALRVTALRATGR